MHGTNLNNAAHADIDRQLDKFPKNRLFICLREDNFRDMMCMRSLAGTKLQQKQSGGQIGVVLLETSYATIGGGVKGESY